MIDEIKDSKFVRTFHSMAEFAASADAGTAYKDNVNAADWYGASFADAMRMARDGWQEHAEDALRVAESAVEMAEKEHMMDTFDMTWAVAGDEVDIGRYLTGEPECMIAFPLSKTSKQGRVITLMASVITSAAIKPETVIRRGKLVCALALALSRLGHSTELWAISHLKANASGNPRDRDNEILVRIKGADDALDPARILFAYAHPSMQRRLCFAAACNLPKGWNAARPTKWPSRQQDRTSWEGAIMLPELRSPKDVPDADVFLRKYLGELGLLAE
jgi:hypothetical protein